MTWDINTAYRLAVASDCAYGANEVKARVIHRFHEKASEIKKEVSEIKKEVNEIKEKDLISLKDFSNLSEDAVKVFTTPGRHVAELINAAILVKIPDGVIIAFRGTEPT